MAVSPVSIAVPIPVPLDVGSAESIVRQRNRRLGVWGRRGVLSALVICTTVIRPTARRRPRTTERRHCVAPVLLSGPRLHVAFTHIGSRCVAWTRSQASTLDIETHVEGVVDRGLHAGVEINASFRIARARAGAGDPIAEAARSGAAAGGMRKPNCPGPVFESSIRNCLRSVAGSFMAVRNAA